MSKITNAGLTRSGTGCFVAVPTWQQCRASKKHSTTTQLNSVTVELRRTSINSELIVELLCRYKHALKEQHDMTGTRVYSL